MRILSGSLKNRRLIVPPGCTLRPTSEKFRAALFNILQGTLEGIHALDLFCGSGAIGIEAISRGAASCTFIDNDAIALFHLRQRLANFGIIDQSTVIQKDALQALHGTYLRKKQYSLIYIDPPYTMIEPLDELLKLIKKNLELTPEANIFLETRKGAFTPTDDLPFTIVSKRTYSDSDLWHFIPATA